MTNQSWFPDTGPPGQRVDATGLNRGTSRNRYRPRPSRVENARLQLVSQVPVSRVPLVCLDLALSPQDWRWLKQMASTGRAS